MYTSDIENRPPTAVNSTTNHCLCPGYRQHALPHTSTVHFKGYNPGVKQTCIRNTIARLPTSSSAAAALKGCSRLRATSAAAAPSWAARSTRGRARVTGVAWWRWVVSRGEGALTVVVCRSVAHSSFNYNLTDSAAAATVWVVARR